MALEAKSNAYFLRAKYQNTPFHLESSNFQRLSNAQTLKRSKTLRHKIWNQTKYRIKDQENGRR